MLALNTVYHESFEAENLYTVFYKHANLFSMKKGSAKDGTVSEVLLLDLCGESAKLFHEDTYRVLTAKVSSLETFMVPYSVIMWRGKTLANSSSQRIGGEILGES